MRIYLKVLSAEAQQTTLEESKAISGQNRRSSNRNSISKSTAEYFTMVLDRTKHENSVSSFLAQAICKVSMASAGGHRLGSRASNSLFGQADLQDVTIWLAPNHRLISLDAVEADDMLVIGTIEQFRASTRFT